MENIAVPILVISKIDLSGLLRHSSDDWLFTVPVDIKQMFKRIAKVLDKSAYRKIGKNKIKTSAFPEGKILFGCWTDNDNKSGNVGIYWSIELRNNKFESLMTSINLTALQFSESILSAFRLLKECAKEECFPGERGFFTGLPRLGMAEAIARSVREYQLFDDIVFDVIQPECENIEISVAKTRLPPFRREENLESVVKNIVTAGPQTLKCKIEIENKLKSCTVEYPERLKSDIFEILKSGRDWNFEFEVFHEFVNGIVKITKLHLVKILGPKEGEDLFIF